MLNAGMNAIHHGMRVWLSNPQNSFDVPQDLIHQPWAITKISVHLIHRMLYAAQYYFGRLHRLHGEGPSPQSPVLNLECRIWVDFCRAEIPVGFLKSLVVAQSPLRYNGECCCSSTAL
jgi:hypothetical protein